MEPFDLIPDDIDRASIAETTIRTRQFLTPENGRLVQGKELVIRHRDLSMTFVPLMWDDDEEAWFAENEGRTRWAPRVELVELDGMGALLEPDRAVITRVYMERL